MLYRSFSQIGAIAFAIICAAVPAMAQKPFDMAPVSDAMLDDTRGTFSPSSFSLTIGQLTRIQDTVARDNFRFTGGINGMSMDNWWASEGAALIISSVNLPK